MSSLPSHGRRPGPRPVRRGRRLRAAVLVAAAAAVAAWFPVAGEAQAGGGATCRFADGTTNLNSIVLAGGSRITYVSSPRILCSDGVSIRADSAVAYSSQNLSQLFGNVRYRDDTRTLNADEARYFSQTGRLQASGRVVLRDETRGTRIENGDLLYLRETPYRPLEEITVTTGPDGRRPKAFLEMGGGEDAAAPATAPADSAAAALATEPAPPTPTEVEADRLFLVGDGFFRASGGVVIDRDSLHATSDSATYDEAEERMLLRGRARIVQADYDLTGLEIDVLMPAGEIGSVEARREALLTGQDIVLRAPAIRIFMEEGRMDRLVAVRLGPDPEAAVPDSARMAQPVAEAETFVLRADSLDVRAPEQALERIWAVGNARGDSSARDSLNVESLPAAARTDWMEGDTVIASFSPVPRDTTVGALPDTAEATYRLDELVAAGDARSLYRLLPSDSTSRPGIDPPAVHYVRGTRITITMRGGQVDLMDVDGPTQGFHLEPAGLRAARDSALADSLLLPDSVPPDTVGAEPAGADASAPVAAGRDRAPNGPFPAAEAPPFHPATRPAPSDGIRRHRRRPS